MFGAQESRFNQSEQKCIRENLKQIRVHNELTMAALAKELDMSRGTVGAYESYPNISEKRLKLFADYYKIDWKDFLMKPEDFRRKNLR